MLIAVLGSDRSKENRIADSTQHESASPAIGAQDIELRNEIVTSLFKLHGPALIRFAGSIAQRDLAEDVVQSVFLKLMSHSAFDKLRLDTAEEYMFRAVHNEAVSFRRRGGIVAHNSTSIFDPKSDGPILRADVPAENSDPAEIVPEKLAIEAAWHASLTLPAGQRDVLRLRFKDDMDGKEIASSLKIQLGTVFSRINRGIASIRQMLAA